MTASQHLAREAERPRPAADHRILGRQRRLQHVAERRDRVDLATAVADRGAVLGRGPGGAGLGCPAPGPGPGGAGHAAGDGLRLAVHHFHRRRHRLRGQALHRALYRRRTAARRPRGPARPAARGPGQRRGAVATRPCLPRRAGHRGPGAGEAAGRPRVVDRTSRSIVIHGHFYQPPREDPWLEEVETEPSAAPFHDWNERIEQECYRAVGAARLPGPGGRIARIVNTYEWLSFNFGPTLLEWLEHAAPETYALLLEADRSSAARLGHGNAVAMPYHHAILPLSSRREKSGGGALGHGRLPAPLRTGTGGNVAAGDRGGRGDPRRAGTGGHPLHHPGPAPGGTGSTGGTPRPDPHRRGPVHRGLRLRRPHFARRGVRPPGAGRAGVVRAAAGEAGGGHRTGADLGGDRRRDLRASSCLRRDGAGTHPGTAAGVPGRHGRELRQFPGPAWSRARGSAGGTQCLELSPRGGAVAQRLRLPDGPRASHPAALAGAAPRRRSAGSRTGATPDSTARRRRCSAIPAGRSPGTAGSIGLGPEAVRAYARSRCQPGARRGGAGPRGRAARAGARRPPHPDIVRLVLR